ncbi:unnamed protein product [Gongylonema pulchrum]|uniref:Uncharacterized protein n=1 Tax=Gongylonema pulchrum TaxID=637853 RepID=A0A183DFV6_9BILA|nr:unnamed protein product [Gongylonema pulchrum]
MTIYSQIIFDVMPPSDPCVVLEGTNGSCETFPTVSTEFEAVEENAEKMDGRAMEEPKKGVLRRMRKSAVADVTKQQWQQSLRRSTAELNGDAIL